MIHVMVDLETLGRRPGCRLLSIGAVVFSPQGLGKEFYREVQINNQGGLLTDQSTMDWWSKQSEEARYRLWNNQREKPLLKTALSEFNAWLLSLAGLDARHRLELCLWGNGADFDNAILHVAYDAVAAEEPAWDFSRNRCYRTLKSFAPHIKLDRVGTHHNALDDAKSQAMHATALMHYLGTWNE